MAVPGGNFDYSQMADNIATRTAQQYGLDPAYFKSMFHAQISQESGFNPNAHSGAGAQGIAQIVPRWHPGVDPYNPRQALQYAAKWDAQNYKKYGNAQDVLSVYNSGRPWSVGQGINETRNYVNSILSKAGQGGTTAPTPRPTTSPSMPGMSSAKQGLMGFLINNALQATGQQPIQFPTFPGDGGYTTKTPLPPSRNAAGVIQQVKQYIGTPYLWGGENPSKGFDCSGLLQYVWGQHGVNIPRTTYDQFKSGKAVNKNNLQPGDAVFFTGSDPKNGLPGHVGMYIGGGQFVEAPHTGAKVRISSLNSRSDYVGARRYTKGG